MWNSSADTKVGEDGVEGSALSARAEIPRSGNVQCSPWWGSSALQPLEGHRGAEKHLQPVGTPPWSSWIPTANCDPVRSQHWAGSWLELWPHGERSLCWSRFAGRTVTIWRISVRTMSSWRILFCRSDQHRGSLWKTGARGKEQGKSVRSLYPKEKAAAGIKSVELITSHILISLPCCGVRGRENLE